MYYFIINFIVAVESLSHVRLFATPWTACQASCFLGFAQIHVH